MTRPYQFHQRLVELRDAADPGPAAERRWLLQMITEPEMMLFQTFHPKQKQNSVLL